jgi:hypothetical protein
MTHRHDSRDTRDAACYDGAMPDADDVLTPIVRFTRAPGGVIEDRQDGDTLLHAATGIRLRLIGSEVFCWSD